MACTQAAFSPRAVDTGPSPLCFPSRTGWRQHPSPTRWVSSSPLPRAPQLGQSEVSPDVGRCPLGSRIPRAGNQRSLVKALTTPVPRERFQSPMCGRCVSPSVLTVVYLVSLPAATAHGAEVVLLRTASEAEVCGQHGGGGVVTSSGVGGSRDPWLCLSLGGTCGFQGVTRVHAGLCFVTSCPGLQGKTLDSISGRP